MLKSLLKMKEQGGHIPKWPLALGYSNGMLGTPADHFFAGAHLKGLRGFDIETAYEDLKNVAMGKKDKNSKYSGRNGIKNYMDKGYVASEDAKVSASRTLEFSFNDFALANLAKALDKKDDAETFLKRSKNYKNIWDKDKSFFRAKKKDGSWAYDFNEEAYFQPDYVEGNARQFLWFVPHDPEGLFELLGGKEKSLERLNKFFEDSKVLHEENQKNDLKKLLPNFYYWHGNEPSIHAALFFSDLGRQDLLTKWLRWIQNSLYDVTPDGLAGNDDAGTLSAWYILTSIGLYPIPGSDQYYLTTPIFDEVEISSSPDKSLKIINKAFLKFGIRSISSAKVGDKSISLKPKHSEIFAEKKAVLTFE